VNDFEPRTIDISHILTVSAYPVATSTRALAETHSVAPKADGTFEWDATTFVTGEVDWGGKDGIRYTWK
jgi:hypothetical protein